MPQDSQSHFDQTVLEMIEHSPIGAVPHTPAYMDAVARLHASQQIYPDADHKGGHVTARSLAGRPVFMANNLGDFTAGKIDVEALETNASIYTRYVQSLPGALQARAESFRVLVIGKPTHHRAKHGVTAVHHPLHTLFLVPGAGPHPGLPGNYLHGAVFHIGADDSSSWAVHVHDSDDGAALFDTPNLADALEKVQELVESAPFHLSELTTLGFRLN